MIKRRVINNPLYLSTAIAIIAVIAVGLILYFHNRNKDIIPSTNPSSAVSNTSVSDNNPTPSSDSPSNSQTAGSNSDKNTSGGSAVPSGSVLVPPYGTFVSDHHPSLSGANNTPSTELSTCTASPGASCYIKFTKGGEVKRLATQTTDGSGSTSWHWDVSQAGLSAGIWDITAVATLGDQTKTTNDTFKLEIQP